MTPSRPDGLMARLDGSRNEGHHPCAGTAPTERQFSFSRTGVQEEAHLHGKLTQWTVPDRRSKLSCFLLALHNKGTYKTFSILECIRCHRQGHKTPGANQTWRMSVLLLHPCEAPMLPDKAPTDPGWRVSQSQIIRLLWDTLSLDRYATIPSFS